MQKNKIITHYTLTIRKIFEDHFNSGSESMIEFNDSGHSNAESLFLYHKKISLIEVVNS